MATIYAKVRQGSRFRWVQSGLLQFAPEYGMFGLLGVNATAAIINPRKEIIHRFASQALAADQDSVEFILGAEETADRDNWQVGMYNTMQVMLYKGTLDTLQIINSSIQIEVLEGFVRPPQTGLGTGSYSARDFSSQDYNTGTGA